MGPPPQYQAEEARRTAETLQQPTLAPYQLPLTLSPGPDRTSPPSAGMGDSPYKDVGPLYSSSLLDYPQHRQQWSQYWSRLAWAIENSSCQEEARLLAIRVGPPPQYLQHQVEQARPPAGTLQRPPLAPCRPLPTSYPDPGRTSTPSPRMVYSTHEDVGTPPHPLHTTGAYENEGPLYPSPLQDHPPTPTASPSADLHQPAPPHSSPLQEHPYRPPHPTTPAASPGHLPALQLPPNLQGHK